MQKHYLALWCCISITVDGVTTLSGTTTPAGAATSSPGQQPQSATTSSTETSTSVAPPAGGTTTPSATGSGTASANPTPQATLPATTAAATTVSTLDPSIERFQCSTLTCAAHDTWQPVPFANSTEVCDKAHQDGVEKVKELYASCREASTNTLLSFSFSQCQQRYCEVFDSFLRTIAPSGMPSYYGGAECEPMLWFNRSLCQTYYRDSELFCSCLCPTMGLVHEADGCQDFILPFLFFGRRGLVERYPLGRFCAQQLAEWVSPLADPRTTSVDHEIITRPEACSRFQIPFPDGHFSRILRLDPYDPCPWRQPTSEVNIMQCTDGTFCDVESDSWLCCATHNNRMRCPANYPVMCGRELECAGQTDHCCAETVQDCSGGRERLCSPLVAPDLQEWKGEVPPGVPLPGQSTTPDPWLVYLSRTTEPPKSFWEQANHIWPAILGSLALLGITSSGVICLLLARRQHNSLRQLVIGPRRLLLAAKRDPVHVFQPTGELPPSLQRLREAALPPKLDWALVEAARADKAASEQLREAVAAVTGRNAARFGPGKAGEALPETEALQRALATVRSRRLEATPEMTPLVLKGDAWLRTRQAERDLDKAYDRAREDLPTAGQPLAPPLESGGLGSGAEGAANEAFLQEAAWLRIEALRDTLREAKAQNGDSLVIGRGEELLQILLGRTVELPAERCVLDPDGHGVKLLPNGKKRALWAFTGDPYTYMPDSEEAEELGADLPPVEELQAAPVDPVRPLCAAYLKRGRCHMGSQCAWRHGKLVPGDVVREPVLQELDF